MSGKPRWLLASLCGPFTLLMIAPMLVLIPGCGEKPGPQRVQQTLKGDTVARSEGLAAKELPSQGQSQEEMPDEPEEPEDEDETGSPDGVTVHHHHHYFPGPVASAPLVPAPLDRATGVIHWPPLLRKPQFSEARYQLDQLFHQRDRKNSGVGSKNYEQIKSKCEAMIGILAQMMEQLRPEEFVGACGFIKILQEEARLPAS